MERNNLEFKIKESLSERTPDVLDKIKNSSQFKVPEKEEKRFVIFSSFKKMSFSLATVFALVLVLALVFSSQKVTPVIASTITVDINPSIQITLDEDDNVIAVTSINADGEEIIRNIRFKGLTLDRAIEIIIEKANEKGFIVETTDENVILINVNSKNAEIKARVEAQLETKITSEVNKYGALVKVVKGKSGEVTQNQMNSLVAIAKENKISVAKLLLIKKIILLDDTFTIADLKDLSVRELYNIEYNLLNPEEDIEPGNNNGEPGNNDDIPGNNNEVPGNNDEVPGNNDDAPGNSNSSTNGN